MKFCDEKSYFVSEASVYRLLKERNLILSPAHIVMKAAEEYHDKTTAPNQMWQTDFTYFKIIGWGWFYLSTILDDFSRYVVAWKLCTNMKYQDVTATVEMALEATGLDKAKGKKRPRLLSDNGGSYVSAELGEWLSDRGMAQVHGKPGHPQTQGKIERWHQTLKNRIPQYDGRHKRYAYNAASARISVIHPDLNTAGYGLDNANRLISVGWNMNTGMMTQGYDSLGRLSGQGKAGGSTSYGYDGIGRLASMTNDLGGTANDVTWSFGRNPAGQVVSSDATSTAYDYDQIASVTNNSTYDGLNRDTGIVSVGGYDARGNLTYEGTGGRTMTYDIENRLLTVNSSSSNVKLDYDPEGRLYRYSADGGTNWTTYLYDGVNLIGEYAGAATSPNRRYIHGTGTDNPLMWLEGSGTSDVRWLYTNYQGSIVAVTGGVGNVLELYKYDAYGLPTNASNTLAWSGGRFRYTGQIMLPEAKLYYYKARVYDPQLGRFMQTDPIGSEDDLNLYAYVAGDPVNEEDPTGQCPNCVTMAIGAGGGMIAGLVGQAAADLMTGQLSDVSDYGGAMIGGAVGGAVFGATGNAFAAGAIGGAAGSGFSAGMKAAVKPGATAQSITAATAKGAVVGAVVGGALGGGAKFVPKGMGKVVNKVVQSTAAGRAVTNNEKMATMVTGKILKQGVNTSEATEKKMIGAAATAGAGGAAAGSYTCKMLDGAC